MLQEFKDFIAKGNVMDMAVGIIIGAAFTAIVKSMVGDLINPFTGLFMGGVDFTNMFIVLSGEGTYASLTEGGYRRGRFCIWRLYYGCDQFPDHRLCCVYVGALREQGKRSRRQRRGSSASARRTQRADRIRGAFGNSGLTQEIK